MLSGALREWFNRSKFQLWIRTGRLPVPEKFQGRLPHAKALSGPGKLFYVCLVCIPNQVFNISLKVRNVIEPKQDRKTKTKCSNWLWIKLCLQQFRPWLTGLYQLPLFSEDLVTRGNPFIRLLYELH